MINKEDRVVENYDEDIQAIEERHANSMVARYELFNAMKLLCDKTSNKTVEYAIKCAMIGNEDKIFKNWKSYMYSRCDEIEEIVYNEDRELIVARTKYDSILYDKSLKKLFSVGDIVTQIVANFLKVCEKSNLDNDLVLAQVQEMIPEIIAELNLTVGKCS